MNTELDLLRRWLTEPGGGMISRPLVSAAFSSVLEEIDRIAGLRTDGEIDSGMSGDDAASELGDIIEWARGHSAARPDPATVYQDPDDQDPEREKVRQEIEQWASTLTDRTYPDCTLGLAMQIDASMPDDTIAIVAPGAAPFFIVNLGPAAPICGPCEGTGELIEYPADEDERIVCCPTCGGTGEATTL